MSEETTKPGESSNRFFEDLMAGFQELREWARGEHDLRVTSLSSEESPTFQNKPASQHEKTRRRHIRHTVKLVLNSTGYKGVDLYEIMPSFVTERQTLVGLSWFPPYNGTQSWNVDIEIGASVSTVPNVFLHDLSEDLHEWMRSQFVSFFRSRPNAQGSMQIMFRDATIVFLDTSEYDAPESQIDILRFIQDLPMLVKKVMPESSKTWYVEKDVESNSWLLKTHSRDAKADIQVAA